MARGKEHLNKLPSKKLDQKRYRPFTIKEEIGQGTYRVELPEGWTIHNVFNKDLLTHCKKAEFASQHKDPAPPPDIINEEEEYEVEEIKGHHKKGRRTQLLAHWKGYCKGTPLFPPLNGMMTLQSDLSLFN